MIIRRLGLVDYASTFEAMRQFTRERGPDTPDELWLLQHPPVFTQGISGKAEHLLAPGDIPIDQGGAASISANSVSETKKKRIAQHVLFIIFSPVYFSKNDIR